MARQTIFFLLILFTTPVVLCAQLQDSVSQMERYQRRGLNERPFDKEKWEEVTEGLDYSESKKEVKKKKTVKTNEGEEGADYEPTTRDPFSLEGGSGIMKFLIILLAVVVIVLLLRGLLANDLKIRNKKVKKGEEISIEKIEEDIENADLEHLIQKALENKQYALAVRLYYLAGLKELALKKDIRWKKDKTNLDYLREMRSSDRFADFRTLTRVFERVWYGDRQLDKEGFGQLEPQFQRFIKQLKEEQLV